MPVRSLASGNALPVYPFFGLDCGIEQLVNLAFMFRHRKDRPLLSSHAAKSVGEGVACGVCGGPMRPHLLSNTFVCPACGFLASYLPVRINQVERIDEAARAKALKRLRQRNFEIVLAEVDAVASPNRKLLDVGCAHGWFLEAARACGYDAVGIEPDHAIAAEARADGHRVILGEFPAALDPGDRYDIITFNDVFEHLPGPAAMARATRRALAPGGVVAVTLPVSDGVVFRLASGAARVGVTGPLARLWQVGLPSPHLSYFSAATLVRLFTEAGFVLVRSGTLETIAREGLYERVRYDRALGSVRAATFYAAALLLRGASRHLGSDIGYFVFRQEDCAPGARPRDVATR